MPSPKIKRTSRPVSGLTERDQLAMAAMQGLIATRAQHPLHSIGDMSEDICASSYVIADQMLLMRRFNTKELRAFLKRKSQPPGG